MTDRSTGLAELRDRGGFTWTELDRGWMAVPDEVLTALAGDGFEECKHAMTTSRRDKRPAGGVWQGVNRTTGSVASAIWVAHAAAPRALVFVEIDGEPIQPNERETCPIEDASHRDNGGER